MGMRFVTGEGGTWHLIDEAAPPDACLIASVKSPVEILALKGLCEVMLDPTRTMRDFEVTHDSITYSVKPYADRGGRLSLRIDGSDGSLSRVETEFRAAR